MPGRAPRRRPTRRSCLTSTTCSSPCRPALRVAGFDALLALLLAAGHEPRMAEPLDGARRAHVADPFGNVVEVSEG